MATMFVASGSERTLADHLLPLLSSPPSIVHTSHAKEKGPSCMISHESKMDVLLLNQAVYIYQFITAMSLLEPIQLVPALPKL